MEKYVKAAEEIASQAITAPPPGANFEVSLTGSQLKPTRGAKAAGNQMTFFSNGSGDLASKLHGLEPIDWRLTLTVTGQEMSPRVC